MRIRHLLASAVAAGLLAACGGGATHSTIPSSGAAAPGAPAASATRTIRSLDSTGITMEDYPEYTASYAHVATNPGKIEDAIAYGHYHQAIPVWGSTVVDGVDHNPYSYVMVGSDPSATSNATSTIDTTVVKLVFTFAGYNNYTLDPSQPATGDTVAVIDRTLNSPIFANATYPSGTTQYVDAFQRANFWNAGGSRDDFHTTLDVTKNGAVQTLNVTVPAGKATLKRTRRTGTVFALIDFDWFYATVPPQILALQRPNQFAIALTYNTFYYVGSLRECCILGYHDAIQTNKGGALKTYGVAAYSAPGIFRGDTIKDVHTLAHEVGEWMDDPLGVNPTPGWNGGQVGSGYCQNNLEVGDPLTGRDYKGSVTTNGYAYHPQELVFFSWFYHQTPPISQNGAYSNDGTLTSPSTCS